MKVLLFGGENGFKNIGDTAMLSEVVRRISGIFPDAEFIGSVKQSNLVMKIPKLGYAKMLDKTYGFGIGSFAKKIIFR